MFLSLPKLVLYQIIAYTSDAFWSIELQIINIGAT